MKKYLPQVVLGLALLFIWPGPALVSLFKKDEPAPAPPVTQVVEPPPPEPVQVTPADWFAAVRPRCTGDQVDLATDLRPPPEGSEGAAYEAACFALAERIPKARSLILGLPEDERWPAAGVVFDALRPTSDDPLDAGSLVVAELVLEFWPNHHGALYDAATGRFSEGDHQAARTYLERFLELYTEVDDRSRKARDMLASIQLR